MKIFHKDKILKKFEKFEISNHLDKKILFGVYWWDVLRAPIYENLILKLKKKIYINLTRVKTIIG